MNHKQLLSRDAQRKKYYQNGATRALALFDFNFPWEICRAHYNLESVSTQLFLKAS